MTAVGTTLATGLAALALALIPSSPGLPDNVRQWLYDLLGGLLVGRRAAMLKEAALAAALAAPAAVALGADWWLRRTARRDRSHAPDRGAR